MANTIRALDPNFVLIINELMTIERQPLTRLQAQRDSISVQKAVYGDLSTKLNDLQSAVKALRSSDPSFAFSSGYSAKVTGVADGLTVLSATAGSQAVPASYQIAVETLAKAHQVRSDRQPVSASQALDLAGTFLIGVSTARAAESKKLLAGTVDAFATGEPASGQAELATGSYYVETRQDAVAGWQFRLVDADGNAVSVQQGDSGAYTSEWQAIPAGGGAYDTGRGLQITFGSDPSQYAEATKANGAAHVSYQAQYAAIEVKTSDSLIDIAYRINKAALAGGSKITATVVDGQLLLTMDPPGLGNEMRAQDLTGSVLAQLGVLDEGGSFKNELQSPANAVFTVNGLRVERSKNTGLTDVINGLTIDLAPDAEGKTATLQVTRSIDGERKALETFITKFNDLMAYLSDKVATTKLADDTYKRGALAGDTMFSTFRYDLLRLLNTDHVNSGGILNLRQLGITMGDNFKLSLSTVSTLETALKENKTGVTQFLDQLMGKLSEQLDRLTGASGYLKSATAQMDARLKETDDRIKTMNERLAAKEEALYAQYGELQAQLMLLNYQSQQFSAIYGNVNTYW